MITKLKLALILIALGFIFIVLDIACPTGLSYPHKYKNTTKVIGEFQYYNIKSNYNARCTYKMIDASPKSDKQPLVENSKSTANVQQTKVIDKVFFKGSNARGFYADIFSDILGFIFIAIGCILLKKCSKRFIMGLLMSIAGFIVKTMIILLPIFINSLSLVYGAFFLGMIYLLINIITIFLVISGLFAMIPGVWCRDERKWCKIIWYAAFPSQVISTFGFWLGADFTPLRNVAWFGSFLAVVLYVALFKVLLRAKHYIKKSYTENY